VTSALNDRQGHQTRGVHHVLLSIFRALKQERTVFANPLARLQERQQRWPASPNPHLLVTTHSAHHPALPPVSYCALRRAFDRTGITPRQMWSDRVLDEAQQTADPVHLVHLFGIRPGTAVRYVHAAQPDKALPTIR
jgi:hypothetical protein